MEEHSNIVYITHRTYDWHIVSSQICVLGEFTSGSRDESGLTEPFTSS